MCAVKRRVESVDVGLEFRGESCHVAAREEECE